MHGLSPDRQLYFLEFDSDVALFEIITTCKNKGNTVSQVEMKRHTFWLPAHRMLFVFDCLLFVK